TRSEGRPGQIWRLQFGPGDEYLAAAGESLVVWTVRTSSERFELKRLCTLATSPESLGVIDLVARPGGTELIYLDRGGRLYSYDLARADDPRVIGNARAALRSLHFEPFGNRLTFVTPGGTLGLWERTGKTAGIPAEEIGRASATFNVEIDAATKPRCRVDAVAMSAD